MAGDYSKSKTKSVKCPKCNGRGTYMMSVTYFSRDLERRTCDLCHGSGKIDRAHYDELMGKREGKQGV